jgi:hypothetical protein
MNNNEWINMNAARAAWLFNALLYHDAPLAKEHVHLLLLALSLPGLISRYVAQLLLQDNIKKWFLDEELQHILQEGCLWTLLMRVFPRFLSLRAGLIALGHTLASIPAWQPFIREQLSSWIMLFYKSLFGRMEVDMREVEKYNSVLCQIWNIDVGEYGFIDDSEKALGLTFVALSNLWAESDFGDPSAWGKLLENLHCTGWMVLRDGYVSYEAVARAHEWISVEITPQFITVFSQPLHSSLIRATAAIKALAVGANNPSALQEVFPCKPELLESITKILEDVAYNMPHSAVDLEQQPRNWYKLRVQFDKQIDELEKSLLC